jgi:hypothetical protein
LAPLSAPAAFNSKEVWPPKSPTFNVTPLRFMGFGVFFGFVVALEVLTARRPLTELAISTTAIPLRHLDWIVRMILPFFGGHRRARF